MSPISSSTHIIVLLSILITISNVNGGSTRYSWWGKSPTPNPVDQPGDTPNPTPPDGTPTLPPAVDPAILPAIEPSIQPAILPLIIPAVEPAIQPVPSPTEAPSAETLPSLIPFILPAIQPADAPSLLPAIIPAVEPGIAPSDIQPAIDPTPEPTSEPNEQPAVNPAVEPAIIPFIIPAVQPGEEPAVDPAIGPAVIPFIFPAEEPSEPAISPEIIPSIIPALPPGVSPAIIPSILPAIEPAIGPIEEPNAGPTNQPVALPPGLPPNFPPVFLPLFLPTPSPTISGQCQTDLPIDIIIIIDQDCIPTDSSECGALQSFVSNIAESILGTNNDVRLALLRHDTEPMEVFNFEESRLAPVSDVVDILSIMPCSLTTGVDVVDPAESLIAAIALFEAQSADDRIKKILLINTCETTVDDDDDLTCSVAQPLLDADDIEVILVNAGDLDDLAQYACLVDDGDLDTEWYPFAQITETALLAVDDTIVDQLCSVDDDTPTPPPSVTSEPSPSPTDPPTSVCSDVSFDLDVTILVDGQCILSDFECSTQNDFISDLIGRIGQAGDNVRFSLVETIMNGESLIRWDFEDSDPLSVSEMQGLVSQVLACDGVNIQSDFLAGLASSVSTFTNDPTTLNNERKLITINYCTYFGDENDVCFYDTITQIFNIDPISINVGPLISEDTFDCLTSDDNNGIDIYIPDRTPPSFESILMEVSERACDPDNVFNTQPPTQILTPSPTTLSPSTRPTGDPTTAGPTDRPTNDPTTSSPTDRPSGRPTPRPTNRPTTSPSDRPTPRPTDRPTARPTSNPSDRPTTNPSDRPSQRPTARPSGSPSDRPSQTPSQRPSIRPTDYPTWAEPTPSPVKRFWWRR